MATQCLNVRLGSSQANLPVRRGVVAAVARVIPLVLVFQMIAIVEFGFEDFIASETVFV